jgi:dTDP-4-amino-4,6-dideoxygalactose transaminase
VTDTAPPIPFNLTRPQYLELREEIDAAVQQVLDDSWFVLGRQGTAFEQEFAAYLGAGHAVGVGSGTAAIHLALWALGVGQGDDVLTVAHTAVATAAAIEHTGATPVFVDVDPLTYTLDPGLLEGRLTRRTKAIVPVHLYGHPAQMGPILDFARRHGLPVVEDCAQAHGARYEGRLCGTMGQLAAFSFYPTKNLGAYGDGGAVVTGDGALAERVRRLREYGWTPEQRYVSQIRGTNSRLDELQASILRVKLRHLEAGNARRRRLADRYGEALSGVQGLTLPVQMSWGHHVYHLFVVRVGGSSAARGPERRAALQGYLREREIGTAVHYPQPVHVQPAYVDLAPAGSLPETERAAGEVLSLPLYPELPEGDALRVAEAIRAFFEPGAGGAG